MKKKVVFGVITLIVAIVFMVGIEKQEYITVKFNTLVFHTPAKLESVTYSDAKYLDAPITFTEEAVLQKWEEGFLAQMNASTFKKETSYYAGSKEGIIITFKFENYDERLKIVFNEPSEIIVSDRGWVTKEIIRLPFERKKAEELYRHLYPENYIP